MLLAMSLASVMGEFVTTDLKFGCVLKYITNVLYQVPSLGAGSGSESETGIKRTTKYSS